MPKKTQQQQLNEAYAGTGYYCTKVQHKTEYLVGKNGELLKHLRLFHFSSAMEVEQNIASYEESFRKEMLMHLESAKGWGIYEKASALFRSGRDIREVRESVLDLIPKEYQHCTLTHDVLRAVSMEQELLKA